MPDDSKAPDILRSWEANADAWKDAVRENRIRSRTVGTNAAILNTVMRLEPRRVLDAGCGEGFLAHRLALAGIDVIGFDGSAALISAASAAGPGRFMVLTYEKFIQRPNVVGIDFDVVLFNFSLFDDNLRPLLTAAASILNRTGALVIQTLHPFNLGAEERYVDGWRQEDFASMGPGFEASMPWFYRTMSSWVAQLMDSGLAITVLQEPLDPLTGKPLSMLITARRVRT